MEDVEQKAFDAYFKRFGTNADVPSQHPDYLTYKNKDYIRLSNCNGVLAVCEIVETQSKISSGLTYVSIRYVSPEIMPKVYED